MNTGIIKCPVKWVGDTWICTKQMQVMRFPSFMDECFLGSCPGRCEKPKEGVLPRKVREFKEVLAPCALESCDKPRAPNRKYCGDRCRKQYARRRYDAKRRRNPRVQPGNKESL